MVSSAHRPSTTTVNRKNVDGTVVQVSCPNLVKQYNSHMGSVDRSDQLKGYYNVDQKSKRWWLRRFLHFMDLAVTNAYKLQIHSYCACILARCEKIFWGKQGRIGCQKMRNDEFSDMLKFE